MFGLITINKWWNTFKDWMDSPWTMFQKESENQKKNPWVVAAAAFFIILPIVNFGLGMYGIFSVAEQIRDPKDRYVTEVELNKLKKEVDTIAQDIKNRRL